MPVSLHPLREQGLIWLTFKSYTCLNVENNSSSQALDK